MGQQQDKLDKWPAGLSSGVRSFTADMSPELELDFASQNLSSGLSAGVGPRYGMAPLPGHADNEDPGSSGSVFYCNNLRNAEAAVFTVGLQNRERILAIVPLSLGSYSAIATKKNHYLFFVSVNGSIDAAINAEYNSGYNWKADISQGLSASSWNEASLERGHKTELMVLPTSAVAADMDAALDLDGKWFTSIATLTVSGKDNPCRWFFGQNTTTPAATTAPSVQLWRNNNVTGGTVGSVPIYCGLPSAFNLQKYKTEKRAIKFYCVDASGAALMNYSASITPSSSIYKTGFNVAASAQVDMAGITATKVGSSTSYSSVKGVLVEDLAMTMNSSYKANLIAAKKPIALITQEWSRATNGLPQQWVDLTNPGMRPRDNVSTYTWDSQSTPTSWGGFAISTEGDANTGFLRKGVTYEFTFSYFNKRLNYETNVASQPYRYTISGANDFVALIIHNSDTGASIATLYGVMASIANQMAPWEFGTAKVNGSIDPRLLHINDYEYRFYYRELGSYEYLPALFIDAAKYWFHPELGRLYMCETAIAGLPGGQPGAFVDYSPLPDTEKFDCVLTFDGRAFWFGESAGYFSRKNNIFAYPGGNSIAAPSGKFRGGIVHVRTGDVEAQGRIVIFGSNESYVSRFTGNKSTTVVQISPDSTGEFDIDGSDFTVDFYTDATAYSHRAACVADGVLYFWGHKGIYQDTGGSGAEHISYDQEPDLHDLVDQTKIDEVHCVFNGQTKEIVWFYPPKTADGYETHGLILNTKTGAFYPQRWKGKIDAAQTVKIEKDESPSGTSGERTMVFARETSSGTVQRPFFFDHKNRGGDMFPKTDMVVKQISTPSAGKLRLTLAAGYDATNFATIAVGHQISLAGVGNYASTLTNKEEFIGKVVAVGAGTIDLTLPSGLSFDTAGTLTKQRYFPIYHETLNQITWRMKTRYWLPGGVNYAAFWLYLYLAAKVRLLKSVVAQTISITYRTPTSTAEQTDTTELVDNSDGNMQRYHGLTQGEGDAADGQALKLTLSGSHIGSEWVLQYLEAHTQKQFTDYLQLFQR